jgi:hypothetical protein
MPPHAVYNRFQWCRAEWGRGEEGIGEDRRGEERRAQERRGPRCLKQDHTMAHRESKCGASPLHFAVWSGNAGRARALPDDAHLACAVCEAHRRNGLGTGRSKAQRRKRSVESAASKAQRRKHSVESAASKAQRRKHSVDAWTFDKLAQAMHPKSPDQTHSDAVRLTKAGRSDISVGLRERVSTCRTRPRPRPR